MKLNEKAISNRIRNDIALFLPRRNRHSNEHILHKDPIPRGGIADEDVGNRPDITLLLIRKQNFKR